MTELNYGFEALIAGANCEQAKELTTKALAAEGFGVLTEIDVAATFRKKLDVEFRPYLILGACNPNLAFRALQIDPQAGLLLPCNVVIQAVDDSALVSFLAPRSMFSIVDRPELEPVVADAEARLHRVAAALRGASTG